MILLNRPVFGEGVMADRAFIYAIGLACWSRREFLDIIGMLPFVFPYILEPFFQAAVVMGSLRFVHQIRFGIALFISFEDRVAVSASMADIGMAHIGAVDENGLAFVFVAQGGFDDGFPSDEFPVLFAIIGQIVGAFLKAGRIDDVFHHGASLFVDVPAS